MLYKLPALHLKTKGPEEPNKDIIHMITNGLFLDMQNTLHKTQGSTVIPIGSTLTPTAPILGQTLQ